MGPQPLSCGNGIGKFRLLLIGMASMGPQPLSCGNMSPCATWCAAWCASMGPQPLSCGNYFVVLNGATIDTSFNGAAASQLRKSLAGFIRRALTCCASMGPQPLSCGNDEQPGFGHLAALASMGPQPLSCGNVGLAQECQPRPVGFNGAAASQLRKSRPHNVSRNGRSRFNGAAASQLRKF